MTTDTKPQAGTRADEKNPLGGIRVLDFSIVMAGPFCTRLLADLGADVIKVEPPAGDGLRERPPLRDGHSTYFAQLNCGKRSIVLDLKTADGLALARRLARESDVVVENFRPGVMKRLGLDYDTLAADNPRLVYCSISGFGQSGPSANKPAYAPIIHAASGFDLAHKSYQDDADKPAKTGIFMADVLGGTYAFGAIQSALLQRERMGRGQHVDVALMDSMLSMLVYECQEAQFPAEKRRHLYTPLKALDGYVIAAPLSQKNFDSMAAVVGNPEWTKDPRYASITGRESNWEELMARMEEWTITRPAQECEDAFMAAGLPCSRYLTVTEAMADPQIAQRGSLARVSDPAGEFLVTNPPFRMSMGDAEARPFVAGLGEHTSEVLSGVLGCEAGELDRLKDSGALG